MKLKWSAYLLLLLLPLQAWAGPLDRFERLVMPGKLSSAHQKYENDCNNCHKAFEKGAQNDLCRDCHKEVNKDINNNEGLHGRIREIETRNCSVCHSEHLGREMNIVPFDRDTFDHGRTDFPLRGTHARLSCTGCHEREKKYRKAAVACVGCHEKDDNHLGRLGDKCASCHTETVWGEAYFRHDKTDFPLKYTHRDSRCVDCHPNERYKDTPKACLTCHKLDDVHEGRHGKKCKDCHTEKSWGEIAFDHDKDTDYRLEGRHVRISCQACHGDDVYKELKTKCVACHEKDDAHNRLFGDKCGDCHQPKAWNASVFKHSKDTDFALKGRHRQAACVSCHRGDVYADLETACVACHAQDDMHRGQEGEKCEQCHEERGWNQGVFFDHDLTVFPLLDAHAVTSCEECHLSSAYQDAEVACRHCHQADDEKAHGGKLGQRCELCHNANDWKKWLFDHNRQTDYKLDGAHENLDCHACHVERVKDKIELATDCYSCHAEDDYHHGAFGKRCERCHVTRSFKELTLRQ